MLTLVLEASTASAKAMLYQTGIGIIDVLIKNYSTAAGDIATYDAEMIMAETLLAGKEILNQNSINQVDIITTSSIWSHSLLMLDGDKKPVSRLKTWADTEASATTEKYRKDHLFFNHLYQRTGCPIHTTYTLWKYMNEKENGRTGNISFIATMPDYLFYKLTGDFAVSRSTASAGGFLNTHTLEWDRETLDFAGIGPEMLPKLVNSEYHAPLSGEAAQALGLPAGIPVLITGADGCMHQVAAGAFSDYIMTLSVGTSAAMRITTEKPILAEYPATWCYVGVEKMWIAGSATAGAGNCVDWIGKKILGFDNRITLPQLDQGARETLKKADAPLFLPFLAGERCPGWDDTRKALFYELRIDHDIYDLYYAVLEGVLFNLKQCYDITIPIVGQTPKFISISGGIEKSPFWLSLAANIFGLPVYTDGRSNASLMGAAIMGEKVMGEISSVKDVKPLTNNCWEPDPHQQEFFAKRYEKYLQYYRK